MKKPARVFVLLSTESGPLLAEFLGTSASGEKFAVRRCKAGGRLAGKSYVDPSLVIEDPVLLGLRRRRFLRIEAEQGLAP